MSLEESDQKNDSPVLTLSELRLLSKAEFVRRADKLRFVEYELEQKSVLRDIELSVRISVNNSERVCIGSSSVMLSLVSEVFCAMFEGDSSLEKGETLELSDKITLPGMLAINALAFGVLSKVQVSSDELASLMAAALYFKVPALTEICNEFIIRNNITEDIPMVTKLITDLNHLGFTSEADRWMGKVPAGQIARLFFDESALRMSADMFGSILKSHCLLIEEDSVWFRCLEWAKQQAILEDDTEVVSHLLKLKHHIRFPLMSEEFLMRNVFPLRLLSGDEFTQISAVKYQMLDDDSLFCPSQPRSPMVDAFEPIWDEDGIMNEYQSISEECTLLSHFGRNHEWTAAFVSGVISNEGITLIEFEKASSESCYSLYGVLESTEQPKMGQYFGHPLKGVGMNGRNGYLASPGKHDPFGEKISKGDRLRLTVQFSDPSHAMLTLHKNGAVMGHAISLHSILDVTQGLRFAVQTYYGCKIRICPIREGLKKT